VTPQASAFGLPPFQPRAPWWGGDLQTLRNTLRPPAVDLSLWPARRLVVQASDGIDQLSAFWHQPRHATRSDSPLVVILHGLTGSADGVMLQITARMLLEAGFPVLRVNLRGAGDTAPHCRRQYHSGLVADIDALLDQLPRDAVDEGVVFLGYSLGGNIVMNHLCRRPDHGLVRAGMSVCSPIFPESSVQALERPRNAAYQRYLVAAMQREALRCALAPDMRRRVEAATSIRHYDDTVSAPAHGWPDAATFYADVASLPHVGAIRVPALQLTARDDPWIPPEPYEVSARTGSDRLTVVIAGGGGHCGFHAADHPQPWHDRLFLAFLQAVLRGQAVGGAQLLTT
jgi:hypothetical protein